MYVGSVMLTLYLPESRSLKDKRQILQSMLSRIRNRYQVAAAEVSDEDIWNRGVIGCACVSNSHSHAQSVLDGIVEWVARDWDLEVSEQVIITL